MIINRTYTESDLIAALRGRDISAFNYLYDKYAPALYGVIFPILNDQQIANELLQEIFLNYWKKIHKYDPEKGRLFTWMLGVARNAAMDVLHSKNFQNIRKYQPVAETVNWKSAFQFDEPENETSGFSGLLEKLKEDQRTLIDLAYFKGFKPEEIAEIEGIPLGTVRSRIWKALIQLRNLMKSIES